MHAHHNPDDTNPSTHRYANPEKPLARPVKTALLMAALVGVFYLLREHWDHLTGNWVYFLLLACPLIHLFMGHGGHGGHRNASTGRDANRKE